MRRKWQLFWFYLLAPDPRRAWSYRRLLAALPALLAGACAAIVGILVATRSEDEIVADYLARARACFQAKDYAAALMCYDRVAHLGGNRPDCLFGLALTLEASGQRERAVSLMRELAPSDRQGHGDAHWWWARRLLDRPETGADGRRALEHHLVRALEGDVTDPAAVRGLLGGLYLSERKLAQAEPLLVQAAKVRPQFRVRLAQLYVLRGDTVAARTQGESARDYFRSAATAQPRDVQARLHWAEAAVFLEDFPEAVAVLHDGLTTTGAPLYRPALARAYLGWSNLLDRAGKPQLGNQLELLQKALEFDPACHDVLLRLWAFTRVPGKEATTARNALRALLASGRGSALVHLALGMDAWQQGEEAAGLVHLEQAYALAPTMGLVANNLAWVLASTKTPDLPRALGLMDSVVKRWPADPVFRDTRGHILARLGRWREALTDLQLALPAYATNPEFHRRLADCYRQLNMDSMGAEHERLAKLHAAAPAKR